MPGITFNCPNCEQPLEAPEEMLGQHINCPSCKADILVSHPHVWQSTPPLLPNQTKPCPYCGESILSVAKKCKHCGEFLTPALRTTHISVPIGAGTYPSSAQSANQGQTTDPFAILTLASALASLVFLPIIFVPIGWLSAILSYYRLKENPNLKGRGIRITGAIILIPSMLWLFYTLS